MRAGSAAVRRAQTGFLRYYAALMIVALSARGPLLPDLELVTLLLDPHLAAAGDLADRRAAVPRALVGPGRARSGSLVTLGVAISFLARFKLGHAGLQFVTDKVWISRAGHPLQARARRPERRAGRADHDPVQRSLCSGRAFREWDRPRSFYFHFGLAESAVLGAFCAQDLALFVGFFDLMLIPFYFLVGMWGSGDRVRATTKLVIYTLVGSFFMLAAAIATGVLAAERPQHADQLRVLARCGRCRCRTPRRSGSSCASPSPSWSRCRWSRSTAGWPTATRRCRSRRWRCSPAWSPRSPPTGSCASCCRCSPTPRRTSRR